MTPLPWWVFLASLLAAVSTLAQHPPFDACVRICRAQSNPPGKIAGVCDHLALQSGRDHTAIQRLSRLCLTPCTNPIITGFTLTFENSEQCRSFRKFLIGLKKCSCNAHETQASYWMNSWLEELFEEYPNYGLNAENVEATGKMVLKGIRKGEGSLGKMEDLAFHRSHLTNGQNRVSDPERKRNVGSSLDGLEHTTLKTNSEDESESTQASYESEEPPVDWEKWCMLQCDNGQGGSACECDILP